MGQLLDLVRKLELDQPQTWVPDLGPVQPDTLPEAPIDIATSLSTGKPAPDEETAFQQWYQPWAARYGMDPNPDSPQQHYDYRAAFKAGVQPPNVERGEHWPSTFKTEGHENLVVGGFHTQTGERVLGTPRASSVEELIQLGWEPDTAKKLADTPEPPPKPEPIDFSARQMPGPRSTGPGNFTNLQRLPANLIDFGMDTFRGATGLGDQGPAGPTWLNAVALGAAMLPLKGVTGLKAALTAERAAETAERFPRFTKAIKAYHGSPHDFEKFSLAKIGTGEGAQAYGHGLYFAENEAVARGYKNTLGDVQFSALTPEENQLIPAHVRKTIAQYPQAAAEQLAIERRLLAQDVARGREDTVVTAIRRRMIEGLEKLTAANDPTSRVGHMYEVNIHADPAHFLDWDAPLSQQSPQVQEALGVHTRPRDLAAEAAARPGTPEYAALGQAMDRRIGSPGVPDVSGAEFYRGDVLRGSAADERAMSEHLRQRGIPGIKYLDQGSRNAGGWKITPPSQTASKKWMVKSSDYNSKGMHFDTEAEAQAALAEKIGGQTRNFVVFDDALIDILKKYGLSAAAIGLLHRALNDRAEHDQ